MDPQYFAHTLSLYEARLFLNGYRKRQQAAWELARYQAFYSAAPHCKNFDFDKMGRFPWEEEALEEHTNEEERLKEIQALRERARARDEQLKQLYDGCR